MPTQIVDVPDQRSLRLRHQGLSALAIIEDHERQEQVWKE
jgi:hypothetical protein